MPATPAEIPTPRIGARVLLLDHLGPHLWDREIHFHYRGRHHHRRDSVYLARLTDTTPTRPPHHTANEKTGLIEHRWWTQPQLTTCPDKLLPPNLPALLAHIPHDAPHQPILLHA